MIEQFCASKKGIKLKNFCYLSTNSVLSVYSLGESCRKSGEDSPIVIKVSSCIAREQIVYKTPSSDRGKVSFEIS